MSTMFSNPITGATPTTAAQSQTPTSSSSGAANPLTDTHTFLTLLVAQLKNQDPMNPADGTTFVTQLATFSGVEDQTQMVSDLDAIKAAITAAAAPAAPATPPAPTSTGAASTGAAANPVTSATGSSSTTSSNTTNS
jgi:hypothetical protein